MSTLKFGKAEEMRCSSLAGRGRPQGSPLQSSPHVGATLAVAPVLLAVAPVLLAVVPVLRGILAYLIKSPLFGACFLLLCQCKNPGTPSLSEPAAVDTLMALPDSTQPLIAPTDTLDAVPTTSGKPVKLDIENPDLFSPEFLNSLTASGAAERVQLTDSFLIADQKDTILFPMDLPLNEWTNFAALKGKYLYSLDVARLNLSTLEFNFELLRSGTPVDQLRGKAHLSGAFFLAAEMDEDERTGEAYPAIEYHCTDHKNCNFSIRIGEMEGELKVKVIKTCKSGKFDIALDDCPTLLEK